ncbi:MAG: AarF/UbiB family protein [Actinomycetia bacterium]|nr:AarF/UbiB family protein [Actinomycetes bacterium]
MTETSTPNKRRRRRWIGANLRVVAVHFLMDIVLIALVLVLMPGFRTNLRPSITAIALAAIVYGLLNVFARPALDTLLMPFVIQTYGFAIVLVDIVIFTLLVFLAGSLSTSSLWQILIGGTVLGLLRFWGIGILGLTPPIGPGLRGLRRQPTSLGFVRFSTTAKERIRLLRVRQMLQIHGIDALFDGDGSIARFRRRIQSWLWQPDDPLVRVPPPVRFRLLLEDLGPTYVKIGQIISSRARTLPVEWQEELEKLQSEVAVFPYEQARDRIVNELGAPPEELYAEFDPVPLAAASLAQVHRAVLHDGRDVAVKIQRPGIHAQLRSDVRILVRMAQAMERRTRWAEDMDLAGIVLEFGTTLLKELDYRIEAYNARRLARVLEPIEGMRVPEVVYELSSSGVLTLEFIHGVKSTDAEAIDSAGLDREVLADRVVRAATKMLMIDGFFHGDPHPGNVFVDLDNGDMVMLDTGMVGELTFQQRIKLGSLLLTVQNGDVRGLAQTLKSLSTPYRETDDARYYQDFERTLTPYLDPPPGYQVEVVAKVLPLGLDILQRSGYRFDSQLTLAMKSMAQAEAITGALVPSWTGTEFMERSFEALKQQVPEALTSDVIKDTVVRQASFAVREAVEQMPSLQEGLLKWFTNLKQGAFKVELDTSDIDRHVQALRGIAMMFTLGILVTGLLIGSALAAGIGGLEDSALEPVTDFASIIFAIAGAIGLITVVILSWRLFRISRPRRRDPLDRI